MIPKEDQGINKNILLAQSLGSMKRDKPILRWSNYVDKGARMLGLRKWWMLKVICGKVP